MTPQTTVAECRYRMSRFSLIKICSTFNVPVMIQRDSEFVEDEFWKHSCKVAGMSRFKIFKVTQQNLADPNSEDIYLPGLGMRVFSLNKFILL